VSQRDAITNSAFATAMRWANSNPHKEIGHVLLQQLIKRFSFYLGGGKKKEITCKNQTASKQSYFHNKWENYSTAVG